MPIEGILGWNHRSIICGMGWGHTFKKKQLGNLSFTPSNSIKIVLHPIEIPGPKTGPMEIPHHELFLGNLWKFHFFFN